MLVSRSADLPGCRRRRFSASYASGEEFIAHLSGFNEVGSIPTAFPAIASTPSPSSPSGYTGAVLSDGRGLAKLDLDKNAGTVTYTLTYSNVGTTPPKTGTVSQAHIHFGKSHNAGGILVFFCTNIPLPPTFTGPTPRLARRIAEPYPERGRRPTSKRSRRKMFTAGDFDALEDALKSNTGYANVHTNPCRRQPPRSLPTLRARSAGRCTRLITITITAIDQ